MKTYEEEEGMDALFRPSPGEIIIGSQEGKRSTKTFITSERSAIMLSLIENHAKGLIRIVQRLRESETEEKLSPVAVVAEYPGCKRWVELHQQLVEHFASVDGFSVQAIVSMEKARWQSQNRADSSTETGDAE